MKRFLSILLVAVLLVAALGTYAFAAEEKDTVTFSGTTTKVTVDSDKIVKVTFNVKGGSFASFAVTASSDFEIDGASITINPANGQAVYYNSEDVSSTSFNIAFKVSANTPAGKYPVTINVNRVRNSDVESQPHNDKATGYIVVEKPACDHKWDNGKVTTKPTCVKEGVKTYTCTVCGETKTESIPANGHDYKAVVTNATCTAGGYTTYTCSVCGDSYVADKTNALGHKWDNGKVTTKPTCVKEGVKTFTCTVCGATKTESVATVDHTYVAEVTKPTCTAGGYTIYTCSVCGDSYKADETKALGHSWDNGKVTTKPTCVKEGVKTYTCTACGETKTEVVPVVAHSYSTVWSKDAKNHWHECSVCGDKADVAAHTWNLTGSTASCGKAGVETYECSVCGQTKTEDVAASDAHSWDNGKVTAQPTCTEAGVKTYTCTVCGATKTESIPAKGHTLSTEWSADGKYHWHECTVCGYQADKAEHEFDKLISDSATCGKNGIKLYQCVCGAYHEAPSPATGNHTWKLVSDTATCGEAGIKTYKCSVCGEEKTEKSEPTGDHDLETKWSYDKKEHWHECRVCGYKADCGEHEFEWHIVKKATAKETGLKQYICETCGYVKKEVILDKVEGLDNVPQTGDITGQLAFGAFAAVMALAAGAWLVLKRKIAK